jgi:hypothetical protein
VTNRVNGRNFNSTDAEHFLCKAWLNAKITFGNYRIIQYPKQCNSFTHPSPVLHRMNNDIINHVMKEMEQAYSNAKTEQIISIYNFLNFASFQEKNCSYHYHINICMICIITTMNLTSYFHYRARMVWSKDRFPVSNVVFYLPYFIYGYNGIFYHYFTSHCIIVTVIMVY